MFFNIIGILIGMLIICFGIYYLIKEKNDIESKKIYTITSVVGIIILVVMVIKTVIN